MADATWKTGTVTVPGSTGTQAVTGLGGTPKAVFFFGTNFLTEDAVDSSGGQGQGVFRGMACDDYSSPGTILNNCAFTSPANQHVTDSHAIHALSLAGTNVTLFIADMDSFDADGFTLDWTTAASGGYKVVYVALMDVTNAGAYIGTDALLTLGWKAGASLLHGCWGGPSLSGSDRSQEFYGGAAYPGTSGGSSWFGAGHTDYSFPTSTGAQHNILLLNNAPSTSICQGGEFIGPSLSPNNVVAYPTGTGLLDFQMTFTSNNGGMVVMWDDEDSKTGRVSTPAQTNGGTVTVSGLPFRPGLVIGYAMSNEPSGLFAFDGFHGATGFSVATDTFQWCALADINVSPANTSLGQGYQSFQRGFVDTINNTDIHAGTIALTSDGFVMTTEEDDATAHDWVWHAFGHPKVEHMWTPQIYRRQT